MMSNRLRKILLPSVVLLALTVAAEYRLPGADRAVGDTSADGRSFFQNTQFSWRVFGDPDEQRVRTHLELQFARKIDEAARLGELSTLHQNKLRLAGIGDIERFFDRVEALWLELPEEQRNAETLAALFERIPPLREKLADGLFERDSLFEKTLRRTLTGEDAAKYAAADAERRAFRYRARVESIVMMWDGVCALRAEQRRQLVQLLLEETQTPAKFRDIDQSAVLLQASWIPEERFLAILDNVQWRVIRSGL